ncbi:MAG: RelA/SpoT domain protein [Parcubacteria group bacterium GW2011_GWB1_40_14]|nr:MAG: RelA/SpoT domain protein [Parcubacteria group bacterium GW2011_GWB1_40_14]
MSWTKLKYTRNQINKAGDVLSSPHVTLDLQSLSMDILSNWRSSHSFPLQTFAVRLSRIAKQVDSNALVVRRLKRVPSILRKLKRDQTSKMKMSRMQDIGGCRAVLLSIKEVNSLVGKYKKSRGIKHKLAKINDYIQTPKKDGYRSIHLIYKYYSDKNNEYDGLLIEIQVRTKLQHYWATAVETVDHFTKQAIKTNEGQKDWMDFFKLVSSAFANIEKTPTVPDTPVNEKELREKIQLLAKKLKVVKKMNEWARIHKVIGDFERESKTKYDFYLLNLDLTTKELKITAYKKAQEELANSEYSKHEERMIKNNEDRDIVLVSAETRRELQKAYPNYFLDAKEFVNVLNEYFRIST